MKVSANKIENSAKFIDFFAHDILDYSVMQENSNGFTPILSVVDIRDVVSELQEIQEEKFKLMKIDVTNLFLNFEEDFLVKTDIKRMQQVLLNLLSNAVKFTPKHGSIVIMVEKQQLAHKEMLRISVTDNGHGIKKKYQSKLFKMFGTFKDTKRGLNTNGIGLGLVISKQIVEKFDGQIRFYSKYKRGTTFFFTFELGRVEEEEVSQFLEN